MLERLRAELERRGMQKYDIVLSRAEDLPLLDESLDCMLVFNAVHHFYPPAFFAEARRTIRPGGLLFIYTRFRDQNARGIWGRFFPGFTEKERRLYDENKLVETIANTPELVVRDVTHLYYQRAATPAHCLERVRGRHYSTFCFYEPDELEQAITGFEANIREAFGTCETLEWTDENVMVTVEKL
jgi:ubiquinone/menaquinone biosynthesis C-methylase UbiE